MIQTIYHLEAKDLNGQLVQLSEYNGKVLLIVNIASRCGYTPQLGELQKLYEMYHDRGFEIIGFPCNQFLFQEPLSGPDIANFCMTEYGVSFRIMEKTKVIGPSKHPVYKYLSSDKLNGKTDISPRWNFYKYLVDRDGKVIDVYSSNVGPIDNLLKSAIERCLG